MMPASPGDRILDGLAEVAIRLAGIVVNPTDSPALGPALAKAQARTSMLRDRFSQDEPATPLRLADPSDGHSVKVGWSCTADPPVPQ